MKMLNEVKKILNEDKGGLKIEFHGTSVIDETDKEGFQVHRSPFSHYIVSHPNGERQHVSVDHDADRIIIHRKDPYRKDGAGRGSKPLNRIPLDDEDNEENIDMIRDAIAPKTRVRMIK